MVSFVLTLVWLGVAGTALVAGLDYYVLPLEERAFSELAPIFSPTGLVGQGLGVVGTAMILLGVVGYSARKRLAFLGRAGHLRLWLQVHIFLCTLGPFLVLLHTTFKFGGVVSIAFWSMAVVVASGVFGRYVYARIPKTIQGRFLSAGAVGERMADLSHRIAQHTGMEPSEIEGTWGSAAALATPPRSLAGALAQALRHDLASRREARRLRTLLRDRQVPGPLRTRALSLAAEQRRLRQQALLLQPFQRLFRYWHVIHLPLALVMLLVVTVHVGVSILFGYTWIF